MIVFSVLLLLPKGHKLFHCSLREKETFDGLCIAVFTAPLRSKVHKLLYTNSTTANSSLSNMQLYAASNAVQYKS